MRIGADERIRIRFKAIARGNRADDACQILQVYLVANAGFRRDHLEILKCRLSPAQKGVTFGVTLKFQLRVYSERVHISETVYLDGVVDHQFGGKEGIDTF